MDRKANISHGQKGMTIYPMGRKVTISHGQKGKCTPWAERHLLTHFAPKKFPPHGQKGLFLPQKNEFAPQKPQKNEVAPQKNEVFEGQLRF
jgi:hypothetical protein